MILQTLVGLSTYLRKTVSNNLHIIGSPLLGAKGLTKLPLSVGLYASRSVIIFSQKQLILCKGQKLLQSRIIKKHSHFTEKNP